jgi:hypothetical protein
MFAIECAAQIPNGGNEPNNNQQINGFQQLNFK